MLQKLLGKLSIKYKLTLLTSLLLFVSILISVLIAIYIASQTLEEEVLTNSKIEINARTENISTFLNLLKKDVQMLSQSNTLHRFIEVKEKLQNDSSKINIQQYQELKESLEKDYYSLSNLRDSYLQLRFLDQSGQEVIRINHDKESFKIIPDEQLQDKSQTNYFLETIKNAKNEFYVSELNLNKERGKIEIPYKPVIRYALPVYNENQEVKGIVIANISANIIFDNIKKHEEDTHSEMYLLDNEGYFLYAPDENLRWGRDLQNNEKLGKYFNTDFVRRVLNPIVEVIKEDDIFFIHATIFPLEEDKTNYWIVLQKIPEATILTKLSRLENTFIFVGIICILFAVIIAYFFSNSFTNPIRQLQSNISQLMKGEIPEDIKVKSQDEIGRMTDSFNHLVEQIEDMSDFADKLGEGNYDVHLKLSSDVVLLDALNTLRTRLKNNQTENEKRKWVTEGLTYFSELLRKQENFDKVFSILIQELAIYLKVHQICFYLFDGNKLVLADFYGLDRKDLKQEIELRDGLVGQVAFQKELLHIENEVEHSVSLNSASQQITLQNLIIAPLKVQNQLEGVLEIADFRSFQQYELDFLEKLCEAIAITVASIRNKENTHKMLLKSQEDTQKLEAQEEELRQNMEELSATQEHLQGQNEELQTKEKELNELLEISKNNEIKINEKNEILTEQEGMLRKQMEKLQSAQEVLKKQKKELEEKEAEERVRNKKLQANESILKKAFEKIKSQEVKIRQSYEELQAQEEELRQNMEELQTTQETLKKRNEVIDRKNRYITSSITYAKNIQQAILPSSQELSVAFKDYFLIYEPKDHISGDFYWVYQVKNKTFFALADCTGHGVPGGLMALIGANLLNQIVIEEKNHLPGKVLEQLHVGVRKLLRQEQENSGSEGMVITFCSIEPTKNGKVKFSFAAAKQNIFYINGTEEIHTLKGERKSIGGWQPEDYRTFKTETLILEQGTKIFLTSDGIFDTPNLHRRKFGQKRFVDSLGDNKKKSLEEQKNALEDAYHQHKRGTEQRDDISVLGVVV